MLQPDHTLPHCLTSILFYRDRKKGENCLSFAWKTESQINPGGEETTGGFTRAWIAWWSTEAPQVFEDAIAPEVERNAVDSVRRGARKRQKTISVNAMTDYNTLMKHGEQWATYYIDRHQRQMRLRERRNAR